MQVTLSQLDDTTYQIRIRLSGKRRWWHSLNKDYRRDWRGYTYMAGGTSPENKVKEKFSNAIWNFTQVAETCKWGNGDVIEEIAANATDITYVGLETVDLLEGKCVCLNPDAHVRDLGGCVEKLAKLTELIKTFAPENGRGQEETRCEDVTLNCQQACEQADELLALLTELHTDKQEQVTKNTVEKK